MELNKHSIKNVTQDPTQPAAQPCYYASGLDEEDGKKPLIGEIAVQGMRESL